MQFGQRGRFDRGVEDHPGIGDQDVDVTGRSDRRRDAVIVGHIESQAGGDIQVVESPGIACRRHHAVTAPGELGCQRAADAAVRAGDEN